MIAVTYFVFLAVCCFQSLFNQYLFIYQYLFIQSYNVIAMFALIDLPACMTSAGTLLGY